METKFDLLFKTGKIGKMKLKNKIIFNPCETLTATVDGQVTQRMIDFYVRRAEGGAALIVVGQTQACTRIDINDPYTCSLRVDDNAYIPMLFELTEAVHRAGAKISILVSPGSGAQASGFPYERGFEGLKNIENVGVSEKSSEVVQRKVRQLSIAEIEKIIETYGLAARRVKQAGFDSLHVHAWAGHLINQFLSPYFNKRDDIYGRGLDGRLRFLIELIRSCRKNVGSAFPIIVKLSIDEFVPGGIQVQDSIKIVRRLEEVGVDAIDAGGGIYESMYMIVPPMYVPKGCMVPLSAAVKQAVKIPVIAGARINEPEMAEGVLREGQADFIAIVRGLLADPNWVNKVRDGAAGDIRKCLACNHCIGAEFEGLPIRCAVNPTVGREGEFKEVPSRAQKSRKVIVVGGGPGGMEAARIAAERGHFVKLFEKSGELGGQIKLAGKPPFREEILNIIEYQKAELIKLNNVEILLNTEVTADDIEDEKADVVVLATGALPLIPEDIEGIDSENVVSAWDVLNGKIDVSGMVVIIGGGLIGAETADMLSEKAIDVTIIKRRLEGEIAEDEETITRLALLSRLQQKGVKVMIGQKLDRINKESVTVSDQYNNKKTIASDYMVMALGSGSYNPLETAIEGRIGKCWVIGDAKEPRKIVDAIREGFFAGYDI